MAHSNIFVDGDQIIADVTSLIGDERMKKRSEGWLIGKLRDALIELGFDTFFSEYNYDAEVPDDLQLKMPPGCIDLVDVFPYNGNSCEGRTTHQNAYYKKGFTRATATSRFAKNQFDNYSDRIIESAGHGADPHCLHYFGIQNNYIVLSDSFAQFEKIRIVYKGIPGDKDICKVPCIPAELKMAVADYIGVEAAHVIWAHEKTNENKALLNEMKERKLGYNGSWDRARTRVRRVHSKTREDWAMYLTKFGHGR